MDLPCLALNSLRRSPSPRPSTFAQVTRLAKSTRVRYPPSCCRHRAKPESTGPTESRLVNARKSTLELRVKNVHEATQGLLVEAASSATVMERRRTVMLRRGSAMVARRIQWVCLISVFFKSPLFLFSRMLFFRQLGFVEADTVGIGNEYIYESEKNVGMSVEQRWSLPPLQPR